MLRHLGFISMGVVALVVAGTAAGQETPYLLHYDETTTVLGTSQFPRALWMAVISEGEGARFLVGVDEPLFRSGQAHPVAIVRGMDSEGLTVSVPATQRTIRVARGQSVPGATELVYREAVHVGVMEYRRRTISRGEKKHREGDLYLVAIRGGRAIVQRDVDPPASATTIQEQRLAAISLVQTAPNTWELFSRDVQVAIESGEAIAVRSLWDSQVDLSMDRGVGIVVKSPLADVRVDQRGFVINNPNLAKRAGLQMGDRILDVNGMPIDGIGSLIRAYQRVKGDPALATVRVTVERNRESVVLTYRIRQPG